MESTECLFEQSSSDLSNNTPMTARSFTRNTFLSEDKTIKYHIGIIDYLQDFTFMKKMETLYKSTFLRKSKKMISCIDPEAYRDRFVQDMLFNVLGTPRISPEMQIRCF